MNGLKRRIVLLCLPLVLISLASFLAAQGPPPCANVCWQNYLNAVHACHGNPTCLANARAAAEACVRQSCSLPPR